MPFEVAILVAQSALAAGWLILLVWNARFWLREPPMPMPVSPMRAKISVLIAARNEERRIPAFLRSLPAPGALDIEFIIADDESSDATAELVSAAAAGDRRIRLVSAGPAPEGWVGKSWACRRAASEASGDWMVFCDADIEFESDIFGRALALAESRNLDSICLIPRMRRASFAVSLLLACLAVVKALFMRPARPGRPGVVQGAFFAIRRGAYLAAGGHEAVRGEILEDMALGRRLAAAGMKIAALPAQSRVSAMMYETLPEARQGFAKHVLCLKDFGPVRKLLLAALLSAMVFIPSISLPLGFVWLLFAAGEAARAAAVSCLVSGLVMHGVVAAIVSRERLPFMSGALLPAGMYLAGHALFDGLRRGIRWKGRKIVSVHGSRLKNGESIQEV